MLNQTQIAHLEEILEAGKAIAAMARAILQTDEAADPEDLEELADAAKRVDLSTHRLGELA